MIITKTPYRVSLFGGGTDHPDWYRENSGAVLSFAIDKYCYLTSRVLPPFFQHKYRIAYSKIETVKNYEEIAHPVVREGIRKYAPELALEIQHHGDLPAATGVGSSSAFAVGLIHSLLILKGTKPTTHYLANEAIEFEQKILRENVGSQDQVACALGGMNFIEFNDEVNWKSNPIQLTSQRKLELEERMVLIFSGISRSSSAITQSFVEGIHKKRIFLTRTEALAYEGLKIMREEGDLDQFGEMLVEGWHLKKEMNSASVTPELEALWQKGLNAGALGGKVLGAGGGGFCMFWLKRGEKENFLAKFGLGIHVPAKISEEGSTLLLKAM